MRMGDVLELACDVTARYLGCRHGERTHLIVGFGAEGEPGYCEGIVSLCAECEPAEHWTVEQADPLTVSPSIACTEHSQHHGWIREGKWVWA